MTLCDAGFVGTRMLVEPEDALATTKYETFAGTATLMSPEPSVMSTSLGARLNERSTSPELSFAWTLAEETKVPSMSPEPSINTNVPERCSSPMSPDPAFR